MVAALSIWCCVHVLLIEGIVSSATHIRTGLRESTLLLRIALLWESLLRITLLLRESTPLRITLLLRESALLLRITLLRESTLLRITLLWESALLLRITLLLWESALLLRITLLLSCIESGETACASLLSLFRLLIEEVEVFALLVLSCYSAIVFSIERVR